ncbi:MAG: hypothetical protein QXP09_14055, partial [Saccharolobus sp.]|uniref:hypothetical protein n=1 Tax=Saccharolobus sp. TaxID=2100761 RepID=UPI0031642F61
MKLYFLSLIPIIMSVILAYLFPLNQLVPISIFWIFLAYLLLRAAFSGELEIIRDYRSNAKWGILSSYMMVHYLLYSIAIENLLAYIYKPVILNFQTSPSIALFTNPFSSSPNLVGLGLSLVFNPTLTFFIPPNLIADLSLYSIVLGLIISILVTSSLSIIFSINKKLKLAGLIPLIGIIAGASCCVSIPVLLAESLETANLDFLSSS